MATTACSGCHREVGSRATVCPYCGQNNPVSTDRALQAEAAEQSGNEMAGCIMKGIGIYIGGAIVIAVIAACPWILIPVAIGIIWYYAAKKKAPNG